ncbi:MAG: glycosyltransferase family 39 protein [Candidatus Aenigmarchaeota archaeon]|nr:glycosyltransferase family 39 protein [Candidatus Aenigmarchaeota archaeon]
MKVDRNGVLIASITLMVFLLFISKSVNLYDFFAYKNMIENSGKFDLANAISTAFGPWGGGSGLSRSSLYVLATYPISYFAGRTFGNVDLILNTISAVFVSISVYFVYLTSKILMNKKISAASAIVYAIMPWVFFNGINASIASMQLMFSSMWTYFISSFYKTGDVRSSLLASMALTASAFVYLSSVFLIPAHFYILYKKRVKLATMIKNMLLMVPAAFLFVYFFLFNPAYPVSRNATSLLFSAGLLSWESVHALSIPILLLLFIGVVKASKKTSISSPVYEIFMISFIALLPSLLIVHYVPVSNFNALFVMVPTLVLSAIKNNRRIFLILSVALVFAAVKTVPMAADFHSFSHPHMEYAQWVYKELPENSTILAGHECPAIKIFLQERVLCRGEENKIKTDQIFFTSEYVTDENEMELAYAKGMLPVPNARMDFGYSDFLSGKNYTVYKSFNGPARPIEDHYQWLYSVYPNPVYKLAFYSALPRPGYKLYKLESGYQV